MYLTKNDLAKRWGVTIRSINRYMEKGLPYTKSSLNGRVYFTVTEVERWEKENLIQKTGNSD